MSLRENGDGHLYKGASSMNKLSSIHDGFVIYGLNNYARMFPICFLLFQIVNIQHLKLYQRNLTKIINSFVCHYLCITVHNLNCAD